MADTTTYLETMRAEHIPEAWSGLWFIEKIHVTQSHFANRHGKTVIVPKNTYTYLRRLTDSTLYVNQPGEVVMEDTPFELRTHLNFVMNAYGSVLVGGLGLGCAIRGLLANPKVSHITCIENSKDVLKMVAPHMPTERLTIIEADALEWATANRETFDCGWYDLWTNRDAGEPHLDIWHQRLFIYLKNKVKHQGAWAYDRGMKTLLQKRGFQWMG